MEPINTGNLIISLACVFATLAPIGGILFSLGKYRGTIDSALKKAAEDINNIGSKVNASDHDFTHSLNDLNKQIEGLCKEFTGLSKSIQYIEKNMDELKQDFKNGRVA